MSKAKYPLAGIVLEGIDLVVEVESPSFQFAKLNGKLFVFCISTHSGVSSAIYSLMTMFADAVATGVVV